MLERGRRSRGGSRIQRRLRPGFVRLVGPCHGVKARGKEAREVERLRQRSPILHLCRLERHGLRLWRRSSRTERFWPEPWFPISLFFSRVGELTCGLGVSFDAAEEL